MTTKSPFRVLLALFGALVFAAAPLWADVVETKSGARIVGQVTKVEDGKVFITTDYAGDLTIKQSEVTTMSTCLLYTSPSPRD